MRKMNLAKLFVAVTTLLAAPMLVSAQQGESHIGNLTGDAGAGKQLYYRYCWGCHGFRGDGNGENAPYLNILPRNFVAATFKCRSHPPARCPLDEDLFNSMKRGLTNSNMPSWITLTDQQRADLVAYIKIFSPRWKNEKPGDAVRQVPAEPPLTIESIKHGQALFRNSNAGSVMVRKAAGMARLLPRSPTATINPSAPITSSARLAFQVRHHERWTFRKSS